MSGVFPLSQEEDSRSKHPEKGGHRDVHIKDLRIEIGSQEIVRDVDIHIPSGKITAVIGPNGCGKTTLLRAIYRAHKPSEGTIHIGDRDIWSVSSAQTARQRAVVTQHHGEGVGFTGREIVEMGRYQHRSFSTMSAALKKDAHIIDEALSQVAGGDEAGQILGKKIFAEMSGGEQQRILIARACAQEAPVIILDEPTNHLDIHAELSILALLRGQSCTRILVVHDINHALAYADYIVVMKEGRVYAQGEPERVMTSDLIADVFGVSASFTIDPYTGAPFAILGLKN